MTITVKQLTEDEARYRRAEILKAAGDEDDFRDRADAYLLDARERAMFDELEGLDYLLGH